MHSFPPPKFCASPFPILPERQLLRLYEYTEYIWPQGLCEFLQTESHHDSHAFARALTQRHMQDADIMERAAAANRTNSESHTALSNLESSLSRELLQFTENAGAPEAAPPPTASDGIPEEWTLVRTLYFEVWFSPYNDGVLA